MSNSSKPILRIFIASTAIDLHEYRKIAVDAILRLSHLPVSMETFGAIPNEPVDVCRNKVLKSDALVVIVAHRYGWVPLNKDGGDGKKSITWIEVETAINNKIPVFAYCVDKNFDWMQLKEIDLLNRAIDTTGSLAISKKVQALDEFKSFLEENAGLMRDTFTTPADLAYKFTTSLCNWIYNLKSFGNTHVFKNLEFNFRVVHPLQRAPHFCGRKQLLDDLHSWWHEPITSDTVCSLVAIGGAGKTATVEQFLSRIKNEKLCGSVLVWSFYEEPNIDAFLEEACLTFSGDLPEGVGGRLSHLRRALETGNSQHLLVLDGLERVQSDGSGEMGYAKGELEGYTLKSILRLIATKNLGSTKALITSQFKITDLAQWEGDGYRNFELEVLDNNTAIEVLKAWNVQGSDEKLLQIAQSVGCHALSVSVLGSYLKFYCNCNPDCAQDFKLNEISADDPLAAKLSRILSGYAKRLPLMERDLLIRLSVFPKGVSIEILMYLTDAGGEIAGALFGVDKKNIRFIAERLHRLGLVYSYERANNTIYTAHPFLRSYFRTLLGVKPADIHEMIRGKLAEGLDCKPSLKPFETEILDKYEMLIEYSIMAGHLPSAFKLFFNVMGGGGGTDHILHFIGDYERIIRINSLFAAEMATGSNSGQLSDEDKGYLICQNGWASEAQGDLKSADSCFNVCINLARKNSYWSNLAQVLQNSAAIALQKCLYPTALKLVEESLENINREHVNIRMKKTIQVINNTYLAKIYHETGEISKAKYRFEKATKMNGEPLYSSGGIYEVEHLNALGDKTNAVKRIKEILIISEENSLVKDIYKCYYWLGILSLQESTNYSWVLLGKIRKWTEMSGHMKSIIRSHVLASEIALCSKDYTGALFEAEKGLKYATGSGYDKLAIDLLILLSKINYAASDYSMALAYAQRSLQKSQHPDICYLWGEADSYFLCGACYKYLREPELAKKCLQAVLTIQNKIRHPKTNKTVELLKELSMVPSTNTLSE